jgi:hypothetical protein
MSIEIKLSGRFLRLVTESTAAPTPSYTRLNDINSTNIDGHFFLVNNGGTVRIVRWGKSAFDPSVRVPEFWTEDNFHRAFKNRFVAYISKGKRRQKPLSQWWLQRSDRYTYDGMVFDSTKEMDSATDEVNLWRGFGVKENPGGNWSLLRQHIRDVLANGDAASDLYLIRWIAWGFQNPTKAAEVAIALMSREKGTGKGILGRALCRIYGGHGVQLVQRAHLVGKFNALWRWPDSCSVTKPYGRGTRKTKPF